MVTWILVLYIYAGALATGDSVALTQIEGFSSQANCQAAGEQAKGLAVGTKNARFVCIHKK